MPELLHVLRLSLLAACTVICAAHVDDSAPRGARWETFKTILVIGVLFAISSMLYFIVYYKMPLATAAKPKYRHSASQSP